MQKYGTFSAERWAEAMIEMATRPAVEAEGSYKSEAMVRGDFVAMAMPIDNDFDAIQWARNMLADA